MKADWENSLCRGLVLCSLHIQDRVRAALFVRFRTPIGAKSHVPVKADRLRVLLVDGELADGVFVYGMLQQPPADALPPIFGGDEQHFQFAPVYARKGDGRTIFVFRNEKARHPAQRLRHIFLDARDLLFG